MQWYTSRVRHDNPQSVGRDRRDPVGWDRSGAVTGGEQLHRVINPEQLAGVLPGAVLSLWQTGAVPAGARPGSLGRNARRLGAAEMLAVEAKHQRNHCQLQDQSQRCQTPEGGPELDHQTGRDEPLVDPEMQHDT